MDETDAAAESDALVEYGIDDRPPLKRSVLLGVQHYLTMIGANIAVPLLLLKAMGAMPAQAEAKFIGTFFVVSGLATLAQTTIGNRYPIVQGAPFSMLTPAIAVIGSATVLDGLATWESQLLFLQGAIITAGLAEVAIGYFGLVGKIRESLSPVVVAPVVTLIGLSLFSVGDITSPPNNWYMLGLTVVLIVAFSQSLDRHSRIFDLSPILLRIVAAWLIAAIGLIPSVDPAYFHLSQLSVDTAVAVPYPLQWGSLGSNSPLRSGCSPVCSPRSSSHSPTITPSPHGWRRCPFQTAH